MDNIEKQPLETIENLTEHDVFKNTCGEDEKGNAKAVTVIKLSDFYIKDEKEIVLDEIVLNNPIINIFKTPVQVMVDLTFINSSDYEFINAVARMQDFIKMENRNPSPEVLSTIVLTLLPKEYLGNIYLTGIHGTFCIIPSKPDVPVDTIRFIYNNEYFHTFCLPVDNTQNSEEIDNSENESTNIEKTPQ